MAKGNRSVSASKTAVVSSPAKVSKVSAPTGRSLTIAKRGINTSENFAQMMSGLMTDLRDGSVTPQIANAICNAGGKLLKVVEMEHRFGRPVTPSPNSKTLVLSA